MQGLKKYNHILVSTKPSTRSSYFFFQTRESCPLIGVDLSEGGVVLESPLLML